MLDTSGVYSSYIAVAYAYDTHERGANTDIEGIMVRQERGEGEEFRASRSVLIFNAPQSLVSF